MFLQIHGHDADLICFLRNPVIIQEFLVTFLFLRSVFVHESVHLELHGFFILFIIQHSILPAENGVHGHLVQQYIHHHGAIHADSPHIIQSTNLFQPLLVHGWADVMVNMILMIPFVVAGDAECFDLIHIIRAVCIHIAHHQTGTQKHQANQHRRSQLSGGIKPHLPGCHEPGDRELPLGFDALAAGKHGRIPDNAHGHQPGRPYQGQIT